jgi:SAM-dependent methyltransferase
MCPSARTICNPAEELHSVEADCRAGGLSLTQEALDFCGFAPGSRIADIGCGKGATVRYLRTVGFDADGIDCDAETIEQAGPYCRLGDSIYLPYQSKSLDGLFFECSLSQMEARHNVLAEAMRVLKDGGKLVISDLYFRSEGQGGVLPVHSAERTQVSEGSPPDSAGWQTIISDAAFTVLLFEDKSDGLANFAAQLLWRHGSSGLKEICGCDMATLRAGRCGSFLMIARKEES